MNIQFFDDPLESPRSREDVRIKRLGFFVYPDQRRVAVGVELTPFLERPSIDLIATNGRGEPAGSMTIIETMTPNFTLTLHLRDREPTDEYSVRAVVYYQTPETERVNVHEKTAVFDRRRLGDQIEEES